MLNFEMKPFRSSHTTVSSRPFRSSLACSRFSLRVLEDRVHLGHTSVKHLNKSDNLTEVSAVSGPSSALQLSVCPSQPEVSCSPAAEPDSHWKKCSSLTNISLQSERSQNHQPIHDLLFELLEASVLLLDLISEAAQLSVMNLSVVLHLFLQSSLRSRTRTAGVGTLARDGLN